MELIGIGARFFLLVNLLKVPLLMVPLTRNTALHADAPVALITAGSLLENLRLFPAVVAGIFGGRWLVRHVPQVAFEWMILVFSAISGLRLLFW
jgi:hypothetical protein